MLPLDPVCRRKSLWETLPQSIIHLFQWQEDSLTVIREIQLLSFLLAISDTLKVETINSGKVNYRLDTCTDGIFAFIYLFFVIIYLEALRYIGCLTHPTTTTKSSFIILVPVFFPQNRSSPAFCQLCDSLEQLRADPVKSEHLSCWNPVDFTVPRSSLVEREGGQWT